MDRSRATIKRIAINDYLFGEIPPDDADEGLPTASLWDDADLEDVEADSVLDDQDLEITRLLAQGL